MSLDEFRTYRQAKRPGELRLGELHLPNGSYKISLSSLYDNLTSWKINDNTLSVDDLVAIIVFGSAVRYPGFTEQPTITKKYWFFGPAEKSIRKVPIKPNDVDFLIVTRKNMTEEKVIPAVRDDVSSDSYGGSVSAIVYQEMHLVCRGVNQMLEGVNYRNRTSIPIDSVSEHVFREGVPLFYNKLELKDLISRSSVKRETPRRIIWDKTLWGKNLIGRIK